MPSASGPGCGARRACSWRQVACGMCGPRLARGEQGLDLAQAVGEFRDVVLGGVLLARLQCQDELAAGLQAASADLGDVVAVLQAHGMVEVSEPDAEAVQRLVVGLAIGDDGGRPSLKDPRGPAADG